MTFDVSMEREESLPVARMFIAWGDKRVAGFWNSLVSLITCRHLTMLSGHA